jgi:8-oxo-dGTP diphosphatase
LTELSTESERIIVAVREIINIDVACAIIEKDGLVLAAQRSETMSLPLKWEFPGGKLEPDESPDACLKRELVEELGIQVTIQSALPSSNWQYPTFAITLHPFVCSMHGDTIRLTEHKAIRWVEPKDLLALDWAAADAPVLRNYFNYRTARQN